MKKIWVRAAPSDDPAVAGKEIVRKPEPGPARHFTATPELVELTAQVARMISLGDLLEVEAPQGEE